MSLNYLNNRRHMLKHPSQDGYKKVLCVCSGGLLRSPTVAMVLSQPPFNYNTRAVGIDKKYALIHIDEFLLEWADEVVCMESKHKKELILRYGYDAEKILCLNLTDDFLYRDPELIKIVKERYEHASQI